MAAKSLAKIKKLQADALALWTEKWTDTYPDEQLSGWEKLIRFWIFVGRSFTKNRCFVRASSLAYTTLLALVPVLAVAISISTGLLKDAEGEKRIQSLVSTAIDRVAPQLKLRAEETGDNRKQIADVISSSIQNVQSGKLGAISGLVLVFIAVSLLSTIETTLNDIWGVMRGRSWLTRIIYYWAVITLGPILLLFTMGLSAGPYLDITKRFTEQFPFFSTFAYSFLPVIVLIMAFAGFYFLMPNTKVEWRAALVGGVVAGILFHLNNEFSSIYFGQVVRQNKLWGGLGSVPVFLVGLYFSWIILLFGAQVSYAFQNRRSYFQEKQAENINELGREFVAFRIMTLVGQRFRNGERPATACDIADALAVPSRLVAKILNPLLQTRIAVEVAGEGKGEVGYAPARPLNSITCKNILDSIRSGIGQQVSTKPDEMCELVRAEFERIQEAESEVASTITLEQMVLEQERLKSSPAVPSNPVAS